ncbi:cyclic nucleotide-binding domain-containing protein [Methylomonas sp. SURF-2]|uniref:Cyclic nucleotide-binding domain-containing protein n=1 Tax=Methylomonas subterranea TaxID=2952225 RepID=A0ABT1TGS0_9GAMM|nr:cyclic nucleotide-binding domain-containing protein [Methylomonas sp. SURF-2]MCQ8104648.1 cyclic nucleotide-binding domain-containing protein [Methylomonas sp. SURF-2]
MQKLVKLLSDPEFTAAVEGEKLTFPADSIMLDEGSEGRDLFVITQGEALVSYELDDTLEHPARLAKLKVNDIFGELSLFDSGPRSAEVKAVSDCQVTKISGASLLAFLDARPEQGYYVLRDLLQHLIEQMRQNNMRTKMTLQMYFHEHEDD